MNEFIMYLVTGLGFACIFEALPWLLGPEKMRDFLLQLAEFNPDQLRGYGIVLLVIGATLIWFARS